MGRKKDKEKSPGPNSPVHRFLGRNSGTSSQSGGNKLSSPKHNVPVAANVVVDGAQNGGIRLRYYGQGDGFGNMIAPPPIVEHPNGCSSVVQGGFSAHSGSFGTFGVPSQPQPHASTSSSSSSSTATARGDYQPPRAVNLLSFQPSPLPSPSHMSPSKVEDTNNSNTQTKFSTSQAPTSAASVSNGQVPSSHRNGQVIMAKSMIPVSAQIHQNEMEKSKSEEDLRNIESPDLLRQVGGSKVLGENGNDDDDEKPLSDGIVREKTPVHVRRHSTGETLASGSPPRAQSPLIEVGKSGNRSPGSQSLASITSTATVISTAGGLDMAGRERGKQTLGDILGQIEQRSRNLLSKTNFTNSDVYSDLQYLAHQSRYSSDAAIKRRIVQKLIECNVLQIFNKVFRSTHKVDYLGQQEVEQEGGKCLGDTKSSAESVGSGGSSNTSIDVATVSSSGSSNVGAAKPPTPDNQKGEKSPTTCTEAMKNLRLVITLLWNTTEKLGQLPICEECVNQGTVSLILSDLGDSAFVAGELGKDQNKLYLVKGYLGILQNTLRFYSDGREAFRSAGAVKILQQYLKSSLLMVKTRTIMLLSYIMSESENDIINASDKNLGFVVKMLQSALESENHYSKKYGFWAVEAASGLNRLASFESNKERIVCKGSVLPLYTQMLMSTSTDEENLVAAKGLWILAFQQESRRFISEDAACLRGLHHLECENGREEIRKMASGALWILDKHNIPAPTVMEEAMSSEECAHVLVSYQWTSKHMVSQVRERLRVAGYKVCTDVEPPSGGSIMEAMADAVNRAAVVLVCMSQKYKDSPSCRTEAEYARDANKTLIPLRLQPKYNPDGWLADLVGNKLFFDLSRGENVEKMIPNLIRELGGRGRMRSMESIAISEESSVSVSRRSVSPLPPPVQLQEQCIQVNQDEQDRVIATWTKEDVTKWLKAKGVNTDKLKQIDGELLVQIRKMRRDAPETYHSLLRADLKFDFLTILRFNNALDKI